MKSQTGSDVKGGVVDLIFLFRINVKCSSGIDDLRPDRPPWSVVTQKKVENRSRFGLKVRKLLLVFPGAVQAEQRGAQFGLGKETCFFDNLVSLGGVGVSTGSVVLSLRSSEGGVWGGGWTAFSSVGVGTTFTQCSDEIQALAPSGS